METITKFTFLILCVSILSGCSLSTKDYIGKYETQFPVDIKAENTQSFFASTGIIESPTGFNAVDLGTINLNVVLNESTNTVSGTGELNIPMAQPNGFGNSFKRVKRNIDLVAMNIKNDTLFFSIQPLSSNSRIDAYLYKENDKIVLGLDRDMCSTKAKGPQFIKENGKYNQYFTNDPQLFNKFRSFIREQINRNDSIINKTTISQKEKQMYINSNSYYTKQYGN